MATSWQSALQADSAWSSHPISVKVQRPEEIDDIFDTISYQKVSRPLHAFSGGLIFSDYQLSSLFSTRKLLSNMMTYEVGATLLIGLNKEADNFL